MGDRTRHLTVGEQAALGTVVAVVLGVVARVGLSIALGRVRANVPVEFELACCLVVPLLIGVGLTVAVDATASCVLGALAASPVAYAVADWLVDARITPAWPEMAPTFELMLASTVAFMSSAAAWAVLVMALWICGRHGERVLRLAGPLVSCAAFGALSWMAMTPPAPAHGAWTAYVAGLDEAVDGVDGFMILDDDPTRFVEIPGSPFFDRAVVSRVPELPTGPHAIAPWRLPSGRILPLDQYGIEGASPVDRCYASTGEHVAMLESSLGALMARRTGRGTWRACAVEGSDFDGLRASGAHLAPFGAPRICAWMLAIGAIAGTVFLGLGSRALRAASRVEGMKLARVEGETGRLQDGTLVRLQTPVPASVHGVLVDPQPTMLEYRENARSPMAKWIAANEGLVALAERHRRRASVHLALALVITVWLALPAVAALRHGFVLSFG